MTTPQLIDIQYQLGSPQPKLIYIKEIRLCHHQNGVKFRVGNALRYSMCTKTGVIHQACANPAKEIKLPIEKDRLLNGTRAAAKIAAQP
ncbi:hypothetical protein A2810_00910 [candidate division Kazan bacterium RIFCSPHIGHO2_01_FULL_49_10]|nr:MAG: hypothetical protein A2810_00910 [candidate division Kazan bacterium RIFCSPHIGHO2_01_FULL_49_10]